MCTTNLSSSQGKWQQLQGLSDQQALLEQLIGQLQQEGAALADSWLEGAGSCGAFLQRHWVLRGVPAAPQQNTVR